MSAAPCPAFTAPVCPVCGGPTRWHDVVDFHKSCLDIEPGPQGQRLPFSGEAVYYARCTPRDEAGSGCGFTFAPALMAWSDETMRKRIYNEAYAVVDPDAAARRPAANAQWLLAALPGFAAACQQAEQGAGARHLDYGGGAGRLSEMLRQVGWTSDSFDPFFAPPSGAVGGVAPSGRYQLITAFEVFEHASHPKELALALTKRLAPGGLLIISTLLSDEHVRQGQPLAWWYAAPRNGHIALHSAHSLRLLMRSVGLSLGHLQAGLLHVAWRPPSAAVPDAPPLNLPAWAAHWFAASPPFQPA